jgi:hypothetical protein
MDTMKRTRVLSLYFLLLTVIFAGTFNVAAQAGTQESKPAARKGPISPRSTAETSINGKKITVDYSRPSMRGRKIMGGLVPYNKVWRTGADSATTLATEADLEIGGEKVPKGTYTLYTWPSEKTWKLIINKQTGQWGTEYDQAQDLARVDMKKEVLPTPIETFTIRFATAPTAGTSKGATNLILEWETTRLSVPIKEAK